jgi:hypothetical protein
MASASLSNPCFELWLILHHKGQTAFLNTAEAERKSRKLDGRAGKRIDAEVYLPLRRAATERALRSSRRHGRTALLSVRQPFVVDV